jgi:2-polyprenyl-3-methyl-5-hydroxy-6-metoxy-1,4-benzoquinol methylase
MNDTTVAVTPTEAAQASADAARSYSNMIWQYRQAETVAAMIYVGDQLGLFAAMADAGPLTADALAAKTGLHPRWLLEWMRLQAAARVLIYRGDDRFQLPPEANDILADSSSRAFAASSFSGGSTPKQLAGLIESFRTGIGKTYESEGVEGVTKSEERHRNSAERQVVPKMIPALDGVLDKLSRGAFVADVGCGDGALVLAMAKAFPNSTFHAMDPSKFSVAHVDKRAAEYGLGNVRTFVAPAEKLPGDARYDLIVTFDCIHDMTRPQQAIDEIYRRLRDDGTWFIKDIRSKPKFEDNLRNPMLAMMYGFSLFSCMASAMSEPGGAGLGTLGFNPEVAERMSRQAGFTRFKMHDFRDPGNLYYEVRR